MDVFAWTYVEMPGLDQGLVVHSLNVNSGVKLGLDQGLVVHSLNVNLGIKPVVQPTKVFHIDVEA